MNSGVVNADHKRFSHRESFARRAGVSNTAHGVREIKILFVSYRSKK
jgi:hypothetical protein